MQFRLFTVAISSLFLGSQACGKYEFFEWKDLPASQKTAAQTLGYDENSWTFPGNNALERLSFNDLELDAAGMKALETLDFVGIDGNCWDRFVNHYRGYDWDELGNTETCYGNNLQDAVKSLGWTQATWDGDENSPIPDSECQGWMELTAQQKWALRVLGWTAIEWMSYALDPRCPAPEEPPEDETTTDQPPTN